MLKLKAGKKGYIIPIGGNEDKKAESKILNRFVELCGGKEAVIVVIPTASRLADTGSVYEKLFTRLGAKKIHILKFLRSSDASSAESINALNEATGVFITGGDQKRLPDALKNTKCEQIIKYRNQNDSLHVAGTSAGAVYLCKHMLTSGESGLLPYKNMADFSEGLQLIDNIVIDQHFSQRDRFGRLLTVLSECSASVQLGLGIDEDTAVFIDPSSKMEVVGSGRVTIVDMSKVKHTEVNYDKSIDLVGVTLHMLSEGNKFDLIRKSAKPNTSKIAKVA